MTNISETQELVLDLLSKELFGRKISIPKNIDWDSLYKESMNQTVLPIVYSDVSEIIPSQEKAEWQQAVYQMLANNVQVLYEHKEIHKLLTEQGIPYTIIKGVASANYYPKPKLRIMGDVDFVVRESDIIRTGGLLEREGFKWVEDKEHAAHHVYHRDSSTWEMHWSMSGIPTGENGTETRKFFSEIIDTAVLDSEGYIIPDEFHHGLVMLIHTAEHLVNTGIGLRHLCDWAVFVERFSNEEFKRLFENKLKACGLWRFAQLLTQLSIKYLGATEKLWATENIDEKYLDSMMSDILAGGNFGVKDTERINQAKLYTNQGRGTVGDVGFATQLIRTMNERAKRALPIAEKISFLLPAGWVYVGIRHLLRIKRGTRPSIHVKKMFVGARERREIYKEFRLFEKEK